jgi:hypothetical protein
LPGQGKIEQGEKQLTLFITQHPELDNWKLRAVLAWLAWRAGRDASPQIASCRKSLTGADDNPRVRVLLDDLSGDWAQAAEAYQTLGESNGAALAHVRLGDQFLRQENPTEAGKHFDMAAAAWQDLQSNCGMALIHYRRAEMAWQSHHNTQVLALLEQALSALGKSPPAMQTEPRASIQKALARVKKNQYGNWEDWQWQTFDDLFRIQLLFPLFALS